MADSELSIDSKKHLLGEILTHIVGVKKRLAPVALGEAVLLERESANLRDPRAIRINNAWGESLGYLSRSVVRWLAPLLDAEKVRIEGYIPSRLGISHGVMTPSPPVVLSVFIAERDSELLEKKDIRTREDVMHQVVFHAYRQAHRFTDPKLIEHLADGLKPLARQKLHPETHLLMALLPGIANENHVANALININNRGTGSVCTNPPPGRSGKLNLSP